MTDSGGVMMLADGEAIEVISPFAPSGAMKMLGTGHKDIDLFLYGSGYQTEWHDGDGWALAGRATVGEYGAVEHVPDLPHVCVRAQGPVGECVRVVIA